MLALYGLNSGQLIIIIFMLNVLFLYLKRIMYWYYWWGCTEKLIDCCHQLNVPWSNCTCSIVLHYYYNYIWEDGFKSLNLKMIYIILCKICVTLVFFCILCFLLCLYGLNSDQIIIIIFMLYILLLYLIRNMFWFYWSGWPL